MTLYHCPTCGNSVQKESFGYPVCCSATMRKGEPETVITPEFTNARLWEMVEELYRYLMDNSMSDWEDEFISDMKIYSDEDRCYSGKQKAWIINLWEKYCC